MKIELQGISKWFTPGHKIISDFSFISDITSLAVIGPSGGGKSTLLRIIGGLIIPNIGSVFLDDKKVGNTQQELLSHRRQLGFVFQANGLFHHLSGRENITLPLIKVHGYSRSDANAVAQTLLKRFSLEKDGEKLPHELSGGQQQRIAIARAVATKPKLLLLDEPTSALDPELTTEVLSMIDELRNDHLSIIVVTHEMGFAKNACDEAVFLSEGKLKEAGTSRDLFNNPRTPELQNFLSKILEWH